MENIREAPNFREIKFRVIQLPTVLKLLVAKIATFLKLIFAEYRFTETYFAIFWGAVVSLSIYHSILSSFYKFRLYFAKFVRNCIEFTCMYTYSYYTAQQPGGDKYIYYILTYVLCTEKNRHVFSVRLHINLYL